MKILEKLKAMLVKITTTLHKYTTRLAYRITRKIVLFVVVGLLAIIYFDLYATIKVTTYMNKYLEKAQDKLGDFINHIVDML